MPLPLRHLPAYGTPPPRPTYRRPLLLRRSDRRRDPARRLRPGLASMARPDGISVFVAVALAETVLDTVLATTQRWLHPRFATRLDTITGHTPGGQRVRLLNPMSEAILVPWPTARTAGRSRGAGASIGSRRAPGAPWPAGSAPGKGGSRDGRPSTWRWRGGSRSGSRTIRGGPKPPGRASPGSGGVRAALLGAADARAARAPARRGRATPPSMGTGAPRPGRTRSRAGHAVLRLSFRGKAPARHYSVISRITRHGLPAARTPSGRSRVTTLPAPMTALEPIRTPGRMSAPPPTHTSEPISMGLPNSLPRRCTGVEGVHRGVRIWTPGPKSVKLPMRTGRQVENPRS